MRLFSILLVGFCLAGAVRAENGGYSLSDTECIMQDMSLKLNRGVVNILTGWGEVPRQMTLAGCDHGAWAVLPVGIPAGVFMTIARTATGGFETVTFFVPMKDSYGPIMNPAFVWQKRKTHENPALQ